jgi:hypothetical protein
MACYLWLFWFGSNLGLGGVVIMLSLYYIGATKRVVLAQKENFLDISLVSGEDLGSGLRRHSGSNGLSLSLEGYCVVRGWGENDCLKVWPHGLYHTRTKREDAKTAEVATDNHDKSDGQHWRRLSV